MPSGICASIDPSEYSEYAIESTTPDFTMVTDEASDRRGGNRSRTGSGAS